MKCDDRTEERHDGHEQARGNDGAAIARGETIRRSDGPLVHDLRPSEMDSEMAQAWLDLYEWVKLRTGKTPMHNHGPLPLSSRALHCGCSSTHRHVRTSLPRLCTTLIRRSHRTF